MREKKKWQAYGNMRYAMRAFKNWATKSQSQKDRVESHTISPTISPYGARFGTMHISPPAPNAA
jgi:hypothetical protein